jgi:hypothetical protein
MIAAESTGCSDIRAVPAGRFLYVEIKTDSVFLLNMTGWSESVEREFRVHGARPVKTEG